MLPRDEERIARFVKDKTMSNSVYVVLQEAFDKEDSGGDVHKLAAQTLARQYLKRAWDSLAAYERKSEQTESSTNRGL